jgi:hypothetical protein
MFKLFCHIEKYYRNEMIVCQVNDKHIMLYVSIKIW